MDIELGVEKLKGKLRQVSERLLCPMTSSMVPSVADAYQQRFRDLVWDEHVRPGGRDWYSCRADAGRFFRLGDYVRFLSFGMSRVDDSFVERNTVGKTYLAHYPVPEMEQALQEASDLTRIWKSDMGFGKETYLNFLIDGKTGTISDGLAEHVAKEKAIDVLVEGYYDGIPVEDLIA